MLKVESSKKRSTLNIQPMAPAEHTLLSIFLKAPRVGEVKTRLAVALGAEGACEAYRILVGQLLRQLAPIPNVELRLTPDEAAAEISMWLREGWETRPQGAGDLGVRLKRAFAEAFARGCKRVVVIGSDCPYVQPADVIAAWAALEETDVVLGPACDGGYWLLGLRAECSALFAGIRWSTSQVLEETLARCRAGGWSVTQLRELRDIDEVEDWHAFRLNAES